MSPINRNAYSELLRSARRATRRPDEAEDLLQTVLLAAVEAGRADLNCAGNRRWLSGALRKRALFDARSAVRRKSREASVDFREDAETGSDALSFVRTLPPGLQATALLALTGHTREEIVWLLRISDAALRQRIAQVRKRWRDANGTGVAELPGLNGHLAFGRIRRSLLKSVRRDHAMLASHDPDGHLFVLTSQNAVTRQQGYAPTLEKE
jgi:DNA-directed RNA polymerase specialized sigma24 family protein